MRQIQPLGDKDLASMIARGDDFSSLMATQMERMGFRETAGAIKHRFWPGGDPEAPAQNDEPETKGDDQGSLNAEEERKVLGRMNKAKLRSILAEKRQTKVDDDVSKAKIIDLIMGS